MFDDRIIYDAHDIDLLQAVKELMLKTVYEAQNLNSITQITEIESDEKKFEHNSKHTLMKIDQSKIKKVESLSTLSSSEMTPTSTVPHTPISFRSVSEAPASAPAPSPPINKASKNSADFDSANILPEGVSRHRKPRRQAYSTALVQASNEILKSYHAAFSANIMANSYLNQRKLTQTSLRVHRNALSLESQHYRQLLNHPHAKEFKLAMRTEIDALKAKQT